MKFIAVAIVIITIASAVSSNWSLASTIDHGRDAYEDGRYGAALRTLMPLADEGNADAQSIVGAMLYAGKGSKRQPLRGMEYLLRAAEQGHAIAQHGIGVIFGEKNEFIDIKKSEKWIRRSADQGYAIAQYDLAVRLSGGDVMPRNPKEAIKWYTKAAEQGMPRAQNNLGIRFLKGEGVTRDITAGIRWIQRAAEQGHHAAPFVLSLNFAGVFGGKPDHARSFVWLLVAEKRKRSNSKLFAKYAAPLKSNLIAALPPDFVAKAREKVEKWLASHPSNPNWAKDYARDWVRSRP